MNQMGYCRKVLFAQVAAYQRGSRPHYAPFPARAFRARLGP
jgi:hypothetical protein